MSISSAAAAKSALATGSWIWLGLAVVTSAIGQLFAGRSGLLGALIGGGLAGVFFGITAIVAVVTSGLKVEYLGAAVLGSWLLKILVLLGVLVALRGADFYHHGMLLAALLVHTIVLLAVEATLLTKAKVPYVEPRE